MLIGLTYDLRDDYVDAGWSEEDAAEFDKVETIDAIVSTLGGLGHEVDQIGGIDSLVGRIARSTRWDLVFNIAEGARGFGREAQIPCMLEAIGVPYTFSDPLTLSVCLHKGIAKSVVRATGIPTPDFSVIGDIGELESLRLKPPLFVKPVAEGTGKGISEKSKILDLSDLPQRVGDLLERFHQPVLVEEYLPGNEYTVGIVGRGLNSRVLGTMRVKLREKAEKEVYSYYNKENYEDLVEYELVHGAEAEAVSRVALGAWKSLGCRDAGRVDLRSDAEGHPNFIEANPLAGLNPDHSDLPILCRLQDLSYSWLIEEILIECSARLDGMSSFHIRD